MWRWLHRLFLLDAPAVPPLGAERHTIVEAATDSRQAAERLEQAAREQAARMRDLEDRLRLLERRTQAQTPPQQPVPKRDQPQQQQQA